MKTFNITIDMLNAKGACMSGMRDFLDKYPESEYPQGVDYQELLDACAAADRDDYGSWLLDIIGRTNAVLEVDEINSEKSIFFAGSIVCNGSIKCAKSITAGSGINAGNGITAGSGITAGRGITAGWGINAGNDYGIYAGLRVRMSEKKICATITTKEEPHNIVCGEFVPKKV